MRQLLIIRHAIAHERDSKRWPDDGERPLTAAGANKFERAARGLKSVLAMPDELLTSSLIRAQQTAAILQRIAKFPKPTELIELRPDAGANTLIAALSRRRGQRIAIVGHEPALSRLVAELLKGSMSSSAMRIKKGALLIVEFDRAIDKGSGRLVAHIPPRILRAMN
jgi:phosphohistidine phosphatase